MASMEGFLEAREQINCVQRDTEMTAIDDLLVNITQMDISPHLTDLNKSLITGSFNAIEPPK